MHRHCDPHPDGEDYWFGVERARSLAAVIDWTAHLLGKDWFPETNWDQLLYNLVLPQAGRYQA